MIHNSIAMMAFILIQLFAGASHLKAQFRIVDAQDGKPVSGYILSPVPAGSTVEVKIVMG